MSESINAMPSLTGTPTDVGSTALSPSEAILLQAEHFSPRDTISSAGYKPPLLEYKVQLAPLAENIAAAILLANIQTGVVDIEVVTRKAWLGLKTKKALVVSPTGAFAPWPEGSFERALQDMLVDGKDRDYSDILYALLKEDSSSPTARLCDMVAYPLVAREVLTTRQGKVLGFLKTTEIIEGPQTLIDVESHGRDREEKLLSDFKRDRKEEWNALREEISRGFNRRREIDNDSMDWD